LPPARRAAAEAELAADRAGLDYMLAETSRATDAAERNPARFGLAQAELSSRRAWALGAARRAAAADAGAAAPAAPAAPPPQRWLRDGGGSGGAAREGAASEAEHLVAGEGALQQRMVAQQDEQLDELSAHVVRIGALGREMGQELHSQSALLDELGGEVDGASTRLAAAQRRVQLVLDRAGAKGQLCIIGVLAAVLVILILLVIA
jgi:SYP6 family syntaxin